MTRKATKTTRKNSPTRAVILGVIYQSVWKDHQDTQEVINEQAEEWAYVVPITWVEQQPIAITTHATAITSKVGMYVGYLGIVTVQMCPPVQ